MRKEASKLDLGEETEARLRLLGNIFRESILPKDKGSEIAEALEKIANGAILRPSGAGSYLQNLADEIKG